MEENRNMMALAENTKWKRVTPELVAAAKQIGADVSFDYNGFHVEAYYANGEIYIGKITETEAENKNKPSTETGGKEG